MLPSAEDFYWIYDLPSWKASLVFIATFVGFYWVGSILVRPVLRQFVRHTPGQNDIVGYILSCFCVFYGLLLGAVLNIAICWLFDMRFITQLVLGGILAAYLGTMMHLIFDMNQPFRGDVSISAEPFEALYKRMNDE